MTTRVATIYHNPKCSASRNALALLRQHGVEPTIVWYLKTPLSHGEIADLLKRLGLGPRDVLRRKGTPYAELGLDDAGLTDADLIDRMVEHPILIERPIVVTARGAALCRRVEKLLDLLP